MSKFKKIKPGVVAQSQVAIKSDELNKERLEECIPVAKEILKILGENEVALGEITTEDEDKFYLPIAQKVMLVFEKYNLKYTNRTFVFQIALQAFEKTQHIILTSLERSFDEASKKMWGKDIMDLQMSDIDVVLKGKP